MKRQCVKVKVKLKSLGGVRLFATPWTVARQAPSSVGFPGKNTGVGCHLLLRGSPHPGIEPVSPVAPALAGGFFTTE